MKRQRDQRKSRLPGLAVRAQAAAEIKWEAINHLDTHLRDFVSRIEARGTVVHWASTAAQARDIIIGIVRDSKARSIIKSKAMTAEEIHLNDRPRKSRLSKVVESDLGEFIVQLRHETALSHRFPSHASHTRRNQ